MKFEDDRLMYAYLNAAVKHALARYNIAPSLDFTLNPDIQHLGAIQHTDNTTEKKEEAGRGYLFNSFRGGNQAHFIDKKDGLQQWKSLYEIAQTIPSQAANNDMLSAEHTPQQASLHGDTETTTSGSAGNILLVQNSMLVTTVKSGLMLIHIRRAQERIWYERLLEDWNNGQTASQQLLFPISCEFPPQDAMLLSTALPDLARIGFDIAPFGQNTFAVQGVPTDLPSGEEKNVLDEVIEQLKHESGDAVAKRTDTLLI
ncbi:MAG: hypothetical protein EOP51_09700, partial [Sphingobacteriales bacterium]